MKKITKFLILIIFLTFSFVIQTNVYANGPINPPANGPINPPASTETSIQLKNPLGATKDIPTLVQKFLEIALKVGVPLIALSIIYTGYLFISAQGAPDKITKAKEALVWVVVGSVILLGAYVIATALFNTIEAIRGN